MSRLVCRLTNPRFGVNNSAGGATFCAAPKVSRSVSAYPRARLAGDPDELASARELRPVPAIGGWVRNKLGDGVTVVA
jgi:hypothetical protein